MEDIEVIQYMTKEDIPKKYTVTRCHVYALIRLVQASLLYALSNWREAPFYRLEGDGVFYPKERVTADGTFNPTAVLGLQCIIDTIYFLLPDIITTDPRWPQWIHYASTVPIGMVILSYYAGIQALESIVFIGILYVCFMLCFGLVEYFDGKGDIRLRNITGGLLFGASFILWVFVFRSLCHTNPQAWVYILVISQYMLHMSMGVIMFRNLIGVNSFDESTPLYTGLNIVSKQITWFMNMCIPLIS